MKTFVLISAIIELVAGALFFIAPQLVPDFADASLAELSLVRVYGAAAIALGVFAIQVWRNMEVTPMRQAFLITYLVFNVGVAAGFYNCHAAGVMNNLGGTILHSLLGAVTAYFYFKDRG